MPEDRPLLSLIIFSQESPRFLQSVRDSAPPETEFLLVGERHYEGFCTVTPEVPGYGNALAAGFRAAKGRYIMTLGDEMDEIGPVIRELWASRDLADVVIASRYVDGGIAEIGQLRRILSRVFNLGLMRALSLSVRDASSAFRIYQARSVRDMTIEQSGYDALVEILVRAYADGRTLAEIPVHYAPRSPSRTVSQSLELAFSALRTFFWAWKVRNSIMSADYDARAHDSWIPLQRYWQRQRYRHITALAEGEGACLDVGAGSSKMISALPPGSVALDVLINKLRYSRRYGKPLVQGSVFNLPFPDKSFPCVICSQVIEHIPDDARVFGELCRVLKPGGLLILGTPDYDRWEWVWTERAYQLAAPNAYADEHITHYTYDDLVERFSARGYAHEATRYILRGELILAFRKPPAD